LTLSWGVSGCGSDDGGSNAASPEINPPQFVSVIDIANFANGADLEISFIKSSTIGISEFRVMVVLSSSATSFGLEDASQVASANYAVVEKAADSEQILLDPEATDTNGGIIVDETEYRAFVLAVAESGVAQENALSDPSAEITLIRKSAVRNLTSFFNGGSGGMDADLLGNIYMGDFGQDLNGGGSRVLIISPTGEVNTFANGLNGASGNVFDSEGNLYQSSITGGFISKIDPQGMVSTFVTNGISGPVGVAFDSNGNLYVANCSNQTIQRVTPDGQSTTFSSGSLFNCPNGIDIDESNTIFVANFGDGNVIRVAPDGTASVFATIPGGNNGHLLFRGDDLFVIGRAANQIFRLDNNGNVELFAGGGQRGNDNGGLSEATFSLPNDLAFSPDGTKMYVNDVDPASGPNNVISPVIIREIDIVD